MEKTFLTFHRVLSFAGIPIFAEKWNSKPWLLLQIFNFMIGVFCFIFTTGFVVTNFDDFHLCIQGACIWTTGVIMTISLAVCLIFRNQFRSFLEEMAFKDAMLEMPLINHIILVHQGGKKIAELRSLVVDTQEKVLKYTRVLLKTYVASVFLCATLYLCSPIYGMVVREDKSLRLLAFDMWFPWSLENYTVYIVSFIFHAYAGYLCCIAYPGLQSTIILFIGQVIRQLKILTFILLHMNELVLEMTGIQDNKWRMYCTVVLSQCVDHYVKIKSFSNRLNVICRPFYLTLILVAIMLVCMCSVKIAISANVKKSISQKNYASVEKNVQEIAWILFSIMFCITNILNKLSLDTMKYYVHEFCFILVVLMFCLMGQQVENQCEALENAVTEKWYIFNRTHKTNVRIFNMALNQRMPIYIFGTITLSLPTFTWFIKTGMSFFTLVMNVLEEDMGI